MQNITLSNILLKLKRGSINDLPTSANEAEPLVTVNADDSRSLYIGTGTAVKPLIDDSMRAKSAFTVYDNSYDNSFHNKFVYGFQILPAKVLLFFDIHKCFYVICLF